MYEDTKNNAKEVYDTLNELFFLIMDFKNRKKLNMEHDMLNKYADAVSYAKGVIKTVFDKQNEW